jgi:hypothetical protein
MRSEVRRLLVRVDEGLTLDAGGWSEVRDEDGTTWREVEPPPRTLFDQLMDHLGKLPPEPRYTGLRLAEEAAAATALCLRWGTYLAVLLDREKPLWKGAREEGLSRISDEEMARINIEASAALERWIDLLRAGGDRSWDLMKKASRLPSVFRSARRDRSVRIFDLTEPEVAAVIARAGGDRKDAMAEVRAHRSRVLANALVNACWRNGYVERVHAGRASAYPLLERRLAPSQERILMREVVDRFAQAMFAVWSLIHESSRRSWEERVRPFHLATARLVTPVGWSLREETRAVRLAGGEVLS